MQSDEEFDVLDVNGRYISSSVCDDTVVLESNDEEPLIKEESLKKAFIRKILMENLKLRKELMLFKCICGLSTPSPFILSCVVTLQSETRRFLAQRALKREKIKMKEFHDRFRVWKAACTSHNRLKAALQVQSFLRGQRIRSSFEGKAVQKIIDMRKTTDDLEVLVLRLSNLHTPNERNNERVECSQIRVV